MKILIQQLARLGDIYMTWPFIRALKRQIPHAEVHILVRGKFESATVGLEEIDRVIVLPNADILEPLVNEQSDIEASLAKLDYFLDSIAVESYDRCYNLSFSPLSSYLCQMLALDGCEIIGYTRHADGFFNPNDEVSSYFYAQVGPGHPNRVHLVDIFASYLEVPYIEADFACPQLATRKKLPRPYVVVHVGASEGHKKLSASHWARALQYLTDKKPMMNVVLIGAGHERGISEEIAQGVSSARLVNLVGDTQVPELFPIIKDAEMLIGCDSAPIHIAMLTDTPTFNVSLGGVNFWETGPKASLGFIYRMKDQDLLAPQKIGALAEELLDGKIPTELITRARGLVSFQVPEADAGNDFAWALTEAIYLGGKYPILDDYKVYQSLRDLAEVNQLITENVQAMSPDSVVERGRLIERGEQILQHISQISPELSPLVRWVAAEKVRIPPGTFDDIKARTLSIHSALTAVLNNYIPQDEVRGHHGQI